MASACGRTMHRAAASIRSNLRGASGNRSTSSTCPLPPRSSLPSPARRASIFRLAPELGCVQSLLPLHTAVAVARMTSCLSTTSSCRALSQGTLCCTSPDL